MADGSSSRADHRAGVLRNSSRRRYLKYGGSALTLSLAGCLGGSGSGSESVELIVAGAGGSWGDFEREFFFDPWEEETGHTVQKKKMQGLQIAQQVQAANGDPNIHLGGMANIRARELGARDLLLPVEEHLSNLDNLAQAAVDEHFAAYIFTPWGIGYNADEVGTEVTGWRDLLKPEFEGKVALPAWGWLGSLWIYGLNAALGGEGVTDISAGLEFVRKLVNDQNAVVMESTDHGLRLFQNGEIVIAPYWNARTDQLENESDINTEFVIPEGGSIGRTYGFAMMAGHTEREIEAMASLNDFVLQAEQQANFVSETGYPPTHENAMQHIDQEVLQTHPTIELSESERQNLAKTDIDWSKVPEVRDQHAEQWRKIVKA